MFRGATRILWPVLLWCLCFAPAIGKEYWSFKTAQEAYDSGEFQLAADIYKRLAAKGDRRAQNELGFLYSVGQGVPQDFRTAAAWFRKSARQGYVLALEHLAGMYATGRGVARDDTEAYKFYSLASDLTRKPNRRHISLNRRNDVARRLTKDQLAASRKKTCRWLKINRGRLAQNGHAVSPLLDRCETD